MTTAETYEQVRTAAVENKNTDARQVDAIDPFEFGHQGDVYLWALPEIPDCAEPDPKPRAQLADGDTQGSRHILDDLSKVEMFKLKEPNPLQGPVIRVKETVTLTHPEHAHVILSPGIYFVSFQRLRADDVRRQMD